MIPPDWPNRDLVRRLRVPPHDWSVLVAGTGPTLLLLHGAGASGHSFAPLIPHLPGFRLIVPDLPGQGFTRAGARRFGLDSMASDLARLVLDQDWQPQAAIGHSAGGALALRLAELLPLRAVVGINAALGSFEGAAGVVFPLMARTLAALPFVPDAVARLWGTPATVRRLLDSTGSRIGDEGLSHYLTLVRSRAHVDGTLGMMAQWDLTPLLSRLPDIGTAALFLTGAGDRTVPPRVSEAAARRLPAGRHLSLPELGHLIHEEAPAEVAAAILPWLEDRLQREP
jgi:magnesium chelatase accessory protein